MKKIALFILGICLFLTSCKQKEINYTGSSSIDIVLLEEYDLGVSSERKINCYSEDELIVTTTEDGIITGKNIGETNVIIENSVDEISVKVKVSLFEEPTFDFGCSQDKIKSLYGDPRAVSGDSILIYGSGNEWYSYAVWEMDFFFKDNKYVEADLYIKNTLDLRLNEFLNDNYFLADTIVDTIDNETRTCYVYLNERDPEDASLMLGKIYDAGPYNDICLFYLPYKYSEKSGYKGDIITRKRIKK
ncbi:MAG: hypothetical protein IKW51_07870 [Bacteroidales bacterium]|nr:hypothetical protein [Bacteroidales bacterium]